MRRAFAAAGAALTLAACGSDASDVPRGDPAVRHGERAVADYLAVEEIRSYLSAASDYYYSGGSAPPTRTLIGQARDQYAALARRVSAKDRVLNREVEVAFERADRAIERGATPDGARDTIGPLADQLMDGVVQSLVPRAARQDAGLQAAVMSKLLERVDVLSDAGLPQLFAQEWGYLRRAQALHVALAEDLGPQKNTVTNAFGRLRDKSFPEGALPPQGSEPEPPAQAVDRIRDALEERFGLVQL